MARQIATEKEYKAALKEVERLMDVIGPDDPDADRVEELARLVSAYEDMRFPIGESTPQEIVDYVLDQRHLTRADLVPLIGGEAAVAAFFRGTALTEGQVKTVAHALSIDPGLLRGAGSKNG